jgi:hypothetical protein
MAHSLLSPNNTASYSAMLLLHLTVSVVNCKCTTYLSLMPKGDIKIVATPAPVLEGSIQSAIKSARTYDFMALLFLKSITCSDNSMAHFSNSP